MNPLRQIYRTNLSLLTDLYQLTMSYGYWKLGRAEDQAVFHLFFRKAPFGGGYAIAAGLSYVLDLLEDLKFDQGDLDYLGALKGNDGQPLFEQGFLDYLRDLEFTCDIDGLPEGTVVMGGEPLLRVRGPILQCQILETVLLNIMNFQTLIATKAARICGAAQGDDVLEFGLRRAQGVDGALAASRAAYIGGCHATSNVLAGKLFGIPVKGTHAHSWVMSFEDEMDAFESYARALPNNCVFLVDTYDTLQGVKKAIEVGKQLRAGGHEMVGIRLDSGDLSYLSIEARKLLDDAGFERAKIVASNDLDEYTIQELKRQGAQIAVWGVGTKLATAYDQPALGGVYKLGAIQDDAGRWQPRVKLSEQAIKTSIPGILQVRRFEDENGFVGDMIYNELQGVSEQLRLVDGRDGLREKVFSPGVTYQDLLVPLTRGGQVVYDQPSLVEVRDYAKVQLGRLNAGIKRFMNPHEYPVGLEGSLYHLRETMIKNARGIEPVESDGER